MDLSKTMLGKESSIPQHPDEAVLTPIPNPEPDLLYCARFVVPEFTSLCPVTAQPDFAHLVIDYVPNQYLVESKSLKLFMFSFRNYGSFHEACSLKVAKRIVECTRPHWLRISAYWYPRGGIPIDVFWQTSEPPSGVLVPETGVTGYRGRG